MTVKVVVSEYLINQDLWIGCYEFRVLIKWILYQGMFS